MTISTKFIFFKGDFIWNVGKRRISKIWYTGVSPGLGNVLYRKIKDVPKNWNFIKTVQMEIFLKNYFQRDYLTKSPIYRTIMYEKRGDYYDREDGIYGAAGGGNVTNI